MESRKTKTRTPTVGFKNGGQSYTSSSIVEESKRRMKALEEENEMDSIETKSNQYSERMDNDEDEEDAEVDGVIKNSDMIFNPQSGLRNWLKSRGKEHCIDFEDEELRQLRNYFNSLDEDGSGSIGVDELEEPLIALGLVDNRQQVQAIVQLVDEDGSEMIEFAEFLTIIRGGSKSNQQQQPVVSDNQSQHVQHPGKNQDNGTGAIYMFFKDLTNGKMRQQGNENIPFSLFISLQRRRKIMQSMMALDGDVRKDGEKILNNYKKQLAERMAREQAEIEGDMTSSQSSYQKPKRMNKSTYSNKQFKKDKDLEEVDQAKLIGSKMAEVTQFQGEPPEPELLLAILKGRAKGSQF